MAKTRTRTNTVRIHNISTQMIALQMKTPGADFYQSEQQIRLAPGQTSLLPKEHLNWDQVLNLQAKTMLKVVSDSEKE
jgi:hypothetical protein